MPEKPSQPSEEELMALSQAGDLEAFETLARRMEPRLYSFIWRYVRNRQTAEDLVQETLLKVYQHRLQFRSGSRVSTWVFTLALNLCRDLYRRSRPTGSLSDQATLAVAEHSRYAKAIPNPEELAERREILDLLMQSLSELPPLTRQLLDLHEKQELTLEEAGKRLGLSASAARTTASRAYKKLREKLSRFISKKETGK